MALRVVTRRTLDLLSTPGALEQVRRTEADIAAGVAIDAAELRRQLAAAGIST